MTGSQYRFANYQIVQYAKAPQHGRVKTRMQPSLSLSQSVQLHCRLVEHCFDILCKANVAPITLSVSDSPGCSLEYFRQLVQSTNVPIEHQKGNDLGERMLHTAASTLANSTGVIIVGSDCPFFDRDYLAHACEQLESGNDCVLGPAADGGYVLIGLKRVDPVLFANIDWGSDRVLASTRQRLQQLQWQYSELPVKADIDRPEDLSKLQQVWPDWKPD